jgi:hypothetical protein
MSRYGAASAFLASILMCANEASLAQDAAICGSAPSLPSTVESDENVRGQLQGQANLLSKWVGKAELAGEVETARKQIYQSSTGYFAAYNDAYLAYIFCLIIFQDKTLNTRDKLDAIQIFRNSAPPKASTTPLGMTLLKSETKALDGWRFVGDPVLPAGLIGGPILPGGGRTRVVFKAADADSIVEIDRVGVVVNRHDLAGNPTFRYNVDPLAQPGFGGARPRQFNLQIGDEGRSRAFYINDANTAQHVDLDNILAGTDFPLLRLDRNAGLQETLDFTLKATSPGLYEIQFIAHATSHGQEYDFKTTPFYIVRN